MKRYVFLFLCIACLFSCNDILKIEESDLNKYPWLSIFLTDDIIDFEGYQNLDTGTMRVSFTNPEIAKDKTLLKIDSIAKTQNWSLIRSSLISRTYSKKLKQYESDTLETIINIKIDTNKNRIYFNVN